MWSRVHKLLSNEDDAFIRCMCIRVLPCMCGITVVLTISCSIIINLHRSPSKKKNHRSPSKQDHVSKSLPRFSSSLDLDPISLPVTELASFVPFAMSTICSLLALSALPAFALDLAVDDARREAETIKEIVRSDQISTRKFNKCLKEAERQHLTWLAENGRRECPYGGLVLRRDGNFKDTKVQKMDPENKTLVRFKKDRHGNAFQTSKNSCR